MTTKQHWLMGSCIAALFVTGSVLAMLQEKSRQIASDSDDRSSLTTQEQALFAEGDAASFGEEPSDFVGVSRAPRLLSITGSDNTRRALINYQGKTRYYALTDHFNGGRVVAILDDSVLVKRGTAYELLCCTRATNSEATARTSDSPRLLDLRESDQAVQIARSYHAKLYQNPLSLFGKVNIEDQISGTLHRYRVYPGSDSRFFPVFGLQPGDRIVAVNGVEVDTRASLATVYTELAGISQITVTLDRAGQTVVVLVSLDDKA